MFAVLILEGELILLMTSTAQSVKTVEKRAAAAASLEEPCKFLIQKMFIWQNILASRSTLWVVIKDK